MRTPHRRLVAVTALAGIATMLLAAAPPATQPATQPTTRPGLDPPQPATPLVRSIQWAHGAATWAQKDAVRCRLVIRFGGSEVLRGSMTYDPHRNRVRIDVDGGRVLVFDGRTAWMSPADQPVPRARFHLLTWPYFLAAPFKLDDPGTRVSRSRLRLLNDTPHESATLTFAPGIGDSPDDWYIVYAEPRTNRLVAMAYIVTYGTPVEEAEKEPHAIVYGGWQTVDGVTFATKWTFHNWSEDEGVHGDAIGSASISGLEFVTPEAGLFEKPEDAVEDPRPAG
jgi:hypothetical protein